MKRVIPGTRQIDDPMRVQVIPRPVASVPAVHVPGQGLDAILEPLPGIGIAKSHPDVIVAPEGEDSAVQDEGRGIGRKLAPGNTPPSSDVAKATFLGGH